jgi:hypothetical protein
VENTNDSPLISLMVLERRGRKERKKKEEEVFGSNQCGID